MKVGIEMKNNQAGIEKQIFTRTGRRQREFMKNIKGRPPENREQPYFRSAVPLKFKIPCRKAAGFS
jgi:hypothetical protein